MKIKLLNFIFILLLSISNNIWSQEKKGFYFKFNSSSTISSDIQNRDVEFNILTDYKQNTFIWSADIGVGAKLNKCVDIGINLTYFPNEYSALYNKNKIDNIVDLDLTKLNRKTKDSIRNAQNFGFKDSAGIFISLNYSLPKIDKTTPYLGFKIGYVDGFIGTYPEFYERVAEAQKEAGNEAFIRDKEKEKLGIEMIKLSPLSYGAIFGLYTKIHGNVCFDILYELNQINFENLNNHKFSHTQNFDLESKGIKKHIILHKFSVGFKILL